MWAYFFATISTPNKFPTRQGTLDVAKRISARFVRSSLPDWETLKALIMETLNELLPTNEAAAMLRFAPQTLRKWACYDNGPIRPVRIAGRLRWRTADLLKLMNGEAA